MFWDSLAVFLFVCFLVAQEMVVLIIIQYRCCVLLKHAFEEDYPTPGGLLQKGGLFRRLTLPMPIKAF